MSVTFQWHYINTNFNKHVEILSKIIMVNAYEHTGSKTERIFWRDTINLTAKKKKS
jgi:hypothetical protein